MLGAFRRSRRALWRFRLAVEILGVYVHVRYELGRGDIRLFAEALRSYGPAGTSAEDAHLPRRLGGAVRRVLAFAPARSRCLVQSLVLMRILARRGIESSLVIGVTSTESFGAHAWVEAGGVALLPPLASRFVPLVRI